jgi:hypothetical protein
LTTIVVKTNILCPKRDDKRSIVVEKTTTACWMSYIEVTNYGSGFV